MGVLVQQGVPLSERYKRLRQLISEVYGIDLGTAVMTFSLNGDNVSLYRENHSIRLLVNGVEIPLSGEDANTLVDYLTGVMENILFEQTVCMDCGQLAMFHKRTNPCVVVM